MEKFEDATLFLQLGLPSTLICLEKEALSLQVGLPSTLICHKNSALSLQLGLPSTLIRHKNGALSLQLGLPSTLIHHKNTALSLQLGLPSTNPSQKRSLISTVRSTVHIAQSLNSPFFPPHIGAEHGRVKEESDRSNSSFARPGSAPIWGGKKWEFRDWTTVHTNPSQKRSFSKTWRNLKTPAFRFPVDGKHFKSPAFWQQLRQINKIIAWPRFLQT